MKIITPYFEFIDEPDPLKKIEMCGRVCYKSESRITDSSAETFVKKSDPSRTRKRVRTRRIRCNVRRSRRGNV